MINSKMQEIEDYYTNDDLSFNFGPMKTFVNDIPEIKESYNILMNYYIKHRTHNLMDICAIEGRFSALKELKKIKHYSPTDKAFDYAAGNGSLNILKWLKANYKNIGTKKSMEMASENGHIEVVKWLYDNISDYCVECCAEEARKSGHENIVEWFRINTITGFFSRTIGDGHLDLQVWLQCRTNNPVDNSMDYDYDCDTNPAKRQKLK